MKKILLGFCLLSSLTFSSCIMHANGGNSDESVFSGKEKYLIKTTDFNAGTLQSLKCISTSADFVIVGDGDSHAYVEMYAQGKGSKEDIIALLKNKYDIEMDQEGSLAKVVAKHQSGLSFFNNENVSLLFKIHVPARVASDIITTSGDVQLMGLNGSQKFEATSGDLKAKNINGNFYAQTSSGDMNLININGSSIDIGASSGDINLENGTAGTLSVKTSSGDIVLNKVKANTQLVTSSGDQEIDLIAGSLTTESSSGSQNITLADPKDGIKIAASSGDVSLSVPKQVGMKLDLKGGSVSMPSVSNFSGDYSKGKSVYGTLNGGGLPVYVRTASGDINLHWL